MISKVVKLISSITLLIGMPAQAIADGPFTCSGTILPNGNFTLACTPVVSTCVTPASQFCLAGNSMYVPALGL